MPNSNKSTNLTKIPDYVCIFFNAFPIFELCLNPIAAWNLENAATFVAKHS